MNRLFGLLLLCSAFSMSAQTVVVWDFATRDGKRNDTTRSFTEEFEEALSQRHLYTVLDRRHLDRLQNVIANEKALKDIGKITLDGVKELKLLGATIVVFGEYYHDVESGDVRITVTFQEFSGRKLLIKRVLMRQALVLDARSRRASMAELVDLVLQPTRLPVPPPSTKYPPPPRPEMQSDCSGTAVIESGNTVKVTFTKCGELKHLLGIDVQPRLRVRAELSGGSKTATLLLSEARLSTTMWEAVGVDLETLHAFAEASGVGLLVLGNRIPITFEASSSPTPTGTTGARDP